MMENSTESISTSKEKCFHGAGEYILEESYRFSLGTIAGIVGGSVVFPIDTVKSLIQYQQTQSAPTSSRAYYNGYLDCANKLWKYEGLKRFYRGLLPVCLGIGPEKAIKLSVNDFIRVRYTDSAGKTPIAAQLLAAATAGAAQTVVTTPYELLRIRQQLGQASSMREGMRDVIRTDGIRGLYRGQCGSLLREVVLFSPIFFLTYQGLKGQFKTDKDGNISPHKIMFAGFISGVLATSLSTPFDVIKTRVQALPRSGISPYVGCLATGQRIFAEEGFKALWKGARARGFAGGIQFGTTVTIYEILKDIGVLCGVPYDIIDRPANRHIKREESDCKQCTIADNVTITHLTGRAKNAVAAASDAASK